MRPTMVKNGSPKLKKKPFEQLSITSINNVITGIEVEAHDRRVARVYMDQLPWRTMSTRIINELHLAVGQRHQSAFLDKRILEKEKRLAMDLALQFVGYRIRSRKEVTEKLKKRKISSEAIEAVLVNLEKSDYLNDCSFTKTWIKERLDSKKFGRNRIKNELLAKGIEVEAINDVLDEVYPLEREKSIALGLARNKMPIYADLDEMTKRRRLTQLLLRRGFGAGVTQNIIRDLLN